MSALTTSIQDCIRGSNEGSKATQRNKMYPDWQRRGKTISVG